MADEKDLASPSYYSTVSGAVGTTMMVQAARKGPPWLRYLLYTFAAITALVTVAGLIDKVTSVGSLPACDAPGSTTIGAQLAAAHKGISRAASCDTAEEASRGVAWASGPLPALEGKGDRKMVYAVFMEGADALSGREAKRRLEAAFAKTGF